MAVKIFNKDDPKSPLIFYVYYFVVYFGIAIQGSFLTLYLTESGVPVKTIGLINGVIQILSLFVLPVLGNEEQSPLHRAFRLDTHSVPYEQGARSDHDHRIPHSIRDVLYPDLQRL